MRKKMRFALVSVLLIATLGIEGCLHYTVDRAADAARDAVKRRAN